MNIVKNVLQTAPLIKVRYAHGENMSVWYQITDQEDIEISEDGKTLHVLFHTDHSGNIYVEIPIEFIERYVHNKALHTDKGKPCQLINNCKINPVICQKKECPQYIPCR